MTRSASCSRSGARTTTPLAASRAFRREEQGLRCLFQRARHARRAAARELADDPVARHARTAPSIQSSSTALGYDHAQARRERRALQVAARRVELLLVRRSPPALAAGRRAGERLGARRRRRRRALAARDARAARGPTAAGQCVDALRRRARATRARISTRASAHGRRHRRRSARRSQCWPSSTCPNTPSLVEDH